MPFLSPLTLRIRWIYGKGFSCLDNGRANTMRAINLRYYYYTTLFNHFLCVSFSMRRSSDIKREEILAARDLEEILIVRKGEMRCIFHGFYCNHYFHLFLYSENHVFLQSILCITFSKLLLSDAIEMRERVAWEGVFHVTTTADINADNKTWHESKKSFNIS